MTRALPGDSPPPPSRWAEIGGLLRSLAIYHGQPHRTRARLAFYRALIGPGDLCFDVGAHVGNHVRAWLALGARVVALEPNPRLFRLLQRLYGRRDGVVLLPEAVGAEAGAAVLHVSSRAPTVSTLSAEWMAAVRRAPSFAGVDWDRDLPVGVTTLDALIERHGPPAFCKLDIEGFEAEALAGLSRPIPQLSFEYLPPARDAALACVARLRALGRYRFNASVGESYRFVFDDWVEAEALAGWLRGLPLEARSGDVYARQAD